MKKTTLLLLTLCFLASCGEVTLKKEMWPPVKQETKPWSRWWWMGSAVDRENIDTLMGLYARAGFGGMEITPIYGAAGYENRYLSFLSPAWMEMLDASVSAAAGSEMGIDMNLGTGWPFGGPQVTLADAACRMVVRKWEITAGKPFTTKITPEDPRQVKAGAFLQVLNAVSSDGEGIDLTSRVTGDGTLDWQPEKGTWTLTALFCGRTLQKVKRAAPGGEGLTLDHFSVTALEKYLSRFDTAFAGTGHGVRAFFNDSYEVYGTNWTPGFPEEFEKRRGYSLLPALPAITDHEDSSETARRIRYDYRQTLSELLLENFTLPWTRWARGKESITRNQAHGSPGNLLDLYAGTDIPECETFGSTFFPIPGLRRDSADIRNVDPDPVMIQFASSAAHLTGKPLTSCETFTWLAEHFRVSLSQCKPEVDQVFLAGVNHVFYHGTTYSPASAGWPGWLFYASVNFAPSNSFWPHLTGLNHYITRCQSVLQSGLPHNDLLVYWPLSDYWMNPRGTNLQMSVHDIDLWLHPTPFYRDVTAWQQEGYSLDFVSDKLLDGVSVRGNQLVVPGGATYKALLFPATRYLPETTFRKAIDLANQGAVILFREIPGDVPGYGNLSERRSSLAEMIGTLGLTADSTGCLSAKTGSGKLYVTPGITERMKQLSILPEPLRNSGLQYIRRKTEEGIYYFLVNHTPEPVDEFLTMNETAAFLYLMDPLTGHTGLAARQTRGSRTHVRVELLPGESVFLYATDRKYRADDWQYRDTAGEPLVLQGPWRLRFKEGGPRLPPALELEEAIPWTDTGAENSFSFSGTAVYSTTFQMTDPLAGEYLLQPARLYESARVTINGKEAGILWSIPFALRVGHLLKPGENHLEIEVANLMANRIRWMDQQKMEWRNYHEINFVNIDYKPFDASGWNPMPSGLQGPVTLTPLR